MSKSIHRRPRYGDSPRLWLARRITDPVARYRRAQLLQDHFEQLANDAGHIKMQAVVDLLVGQLDGDIEEAARLIGRDTRWVRDVVRLMADLQKPVA